VPKLACSTVSYEQLNEFFEKARDERTRSLSGPLHFNELLRTFGVASVRFHQCPIAITDRQPTPGGMWNQGIAFGWPPTLRNGTVCWKSRKEVSRSGSGRHDHAGRQYGICSRRWRLAGGKRSRTRHVLPKKRTSRIPLHCPCISCESGHYMGRDRFETHCKAYLKQGYEIDPWFVTSISTDGELLASTLVRGSGRKICWNLPASGR